MTKFPVMPPYLLAPWSPTFDHRPEGPGHGAQLRALFANIARLLAARSPLFGVFYLPLCNYLSRTFRRLTTLLDAIAAGTLRTPRPRPKRERGTRAPPIRLPAKQDWLGHTLGWEIRGYGSHLEIFLNTPETQALLLQEPARAARLLRPLARIFGIAPAALPPPTPRQPRPKKPRERKPRPRRLTRAERVAALHYSNLEGRPMKLLPPRKRR